MYWRHSIYAYNEAASDNFDQRNKLMFEQVSWFRRRDWHILTTGVLTYTSDERFSVFHPEGTDDWTLQIKYTTSRDNGTYECQV